MPTTTMTTTARAIRRLRIITSIDYILGHPARPRNEGGLHADLHRPRQLQRSGDPEHQGRPQAPRRRQEDAEGHGRRAEAVLSDDGRPRHRHGHGGPERRDGREVHSHALRGRQRPHDDDEGVHRGGVPEADLDASVTLPEYRVKARNTAESPENKIHDDAVARQYGFRGGPAGPVNPRALPDGAAARRAARRHAPPPRRPRRARHTGHHLRRRARRRVSGEGRRRARALPRRARLRPPRLLPRPGQPRPRQERDAEPVDPRRERGAPPVRGARRRDPRDAGPGPLALRKEGTRVRRARPGDRRRRAFSPRHPHPAYRDLPAAGALAPPHPTPPDRRRRTCPGNAPVCSPPSTTGTPLTITVTIPTGYW